MPHDYYDNALMTGLAPDTAFIPGEQNVKGGVSWDHLPDTEFDLSIDDPRYQRCVHYARELKTTHEIKALALTGASHDTLESKEKEIVTALQHKIREEYGRYNPRFDPNSDHEIHGDATRIKTDNPARLEEFSRDELVCRHFGPLMSALCTEAGISNFTVHGLVNDYRVYGDNVRSISLDNPRHTYVVSRLTGNIIEPSTDPNNVYKRNLANCSIDDMIIGESIVTSVGEHHYSVYGTGKSLHEDNRANDHQHNVLAARRIELEKGHWERMSTLRQMDKEAAERYGQIAVERYHREQMQPAIAQLEEAVQKGEGDTIDDLCGRFNFSQARLVKNLCTAITNQDVSTAQQLVKHGALAPSDLSPPPASLMFLLDGDTLKQNALGERLLKTLHVDATEYQKEAISRGEEGHMALAEHYMTEASSPATSPLMMDIERPLSITNQTTVKISR